MSWPRRFSSVPFVLSALVWPALCAAQITAPSAEQRPVAVPPKVLSNTDIAYPEGATGEAVVILTLTIAADGSVQSAVPNAVNTPFSELAVQHALGWKFEPATRDGKPILVK